VSIEVKATSAAAPERVWELYVRPARWSEWAPHVRAPSGLGDPEVRAGAEGSIRLMGTVPVPARITAVEPDRAWAWRVGPAELRHTVAPATGGGSEIGLEIRAPRALELALRIGYAPLAGLLLRNLARVAERAEGPAPLA
jgi:uncharacterized protein YndB with AHSA1/START domain